MDADCLRACRCLSCRKQKVCLGIFRATYAWELTKPALQMRCLVQDGQDGDGAPCKRCAAVGREVRIFHLQASVTGLH